MYRNYIRILAQLQIDRRLQGRVAPSDLVQDTIIEAEQNFTGFRGRSEGELIAWLRTVLSTQVARVYRHHSAKQRDFQLEAQLNVEMDQSSHLLQRAFDMKHSTPSHIAARREEVVLLADALEHLPRDYRDVILLRNLEGLPFDAVAERHGSHCPQRQKPLARRAWHVTRRFGGRSMSATMDQNRRPYMEAASADFLSSQETQLALAVEAYLAELESGQQPDRAEFLTRYSENSRAKTKGES